MDASTETTPQQPDNEQTSQKFNRREAFTKLFAVASGLLGLGYLTKRTIDESDRITTQTKITVDKVKANRAARYSLPLYSSTEINRQLNQNQISKPSDPELVHFVTEIKTLSDKDLQNRILSLELNTFYRLESEKEYFNRANNLTLIDQGFWLINDPTLRALLLRKRYNLRIEGHNQLSKLTDQQINWAFESGIHPEVLGICNDAYPKARAIIQKLLDQSKSNFRPDLFYKNKIGDIDQSTIDQLSPDLIMINAGGLSKLICTETGFDMMTTDKRKVQYGFSYIGTDSAYKFINEKQFPTGKQSLNILCQKTTQITGLSFKTDNIPGSSPSSSDVSGGAVGIQFMPDNIVAMMQLFESIGEVFNPFDITSQTVAAWVFLARGQKVNDGYRYGYIKDTQPGDEHITKSIRIASVLKWNPHQEQMASILSSAESYYTKIIKAN